MRNFKQIKRILNDPRSKEYKELIYLISRRKNGLIYSIMHSMANKRIQYNLNRMRNISPNNLDYSFEAELVKKKCMRSAMISVN